MKINSDAGDAKEIRIYINLLFCLKGNYFANM